MKTLLITFNLLGGLAVFLLGMKSMSDGLQKMAGVKLRQWLSAATGNRFAATLSGMLVTAVIQSSSATTVMVVGFTSAGLLTLYQALGMIFGANIGTTLTAWIVSLFGFKIQISLFALPVIALGFFSQFLPKQWVLLRRIGEAAVGFGLLFLGLDIMKNTLPADFAQHPLITQWLSHFSPDTLFHLIALIGSGALLTVLLQSSSAVMAMTLTCAAAGIINFPAACALVLGENIGTTITANLAALGAPKNARRAALGHFLFNFFGVIWVSSLFAHFIKLIDWLVPGSPYVTDPAALSNVLPYHIAAFHTVFNIINTLLMLPLLKPLAALTLRVIPEDKRSKHTQSDRLVYVSAPLCQTPELAIVAARKELERMLGFVLKQTDKILYALKTTDRKLFARLITDAKNCERTIDTLEYQLNSYLMQLTHGNLSRHAVAQTVVLFDLAGSIESMSDCGEHIADLLEKHLLVQPPVFTQADREHLELMAKKTKDILKHTRTALGHFPKQVSLSKQTAEQWLHQAVSRENNLNRLHQQMRSERNLRVTEGKNSSAVSITAFSDILNHFERIGDYALHITEESLLNKPSLHHAVQFSAAKNRRLT